MSAPTEVWRPVLAKMVWTIDGPGPFGGLRACNKQQAVDACEALNERLSPELCSVCGGQTEEERLVCSACTESLHGEVRL